MSNESDFRGLLTDGELRASVLYHVGPYSDVLRRHQDDVHAAVRDGIGGVRALAPHLLDRITDERTLRIAWEYLAINGGSSPGPDGRRYADYATSEGREYCRALRDALRGRTYRTGPERIIRIEKDGGSGFRPIVLLNIQDRVVQRAVVSILQPVLDPLFDPRTFGYRPKLGHLHALACAERLTFSKNRWIWLTHDIRDAFLHVPMSRLLQVVRKFLPDDDLLKLLEMLLRGKCLPGLRQGGPLSPLMMNLYLHHFLDRPWRSRNPQMPLIRVADDLLVLCKTRRQAKAAGAELRQLLQPTGMFLKDAPEAALRDLNAGDAAEWMGFTIRKAGRGLACEINKRSWKRLRKNLALAHTKADSPLRAIHTIKQWLNQRGPCYRWSDREAVVQKIIAAANEQAFEEVPGPAELQHHWLRANSRWGRIRKAARAGE